jgi:hypothetical protein
MWESRECGKVGLLEMESGALRRDLESLRQAKLRRRHGIT